MKYVYNILYIYLYIVVIYIYIYSYFIYLQMSKDHKNLRSLNLFEKKPLFINIIGLLRI